MKVLMVIVPLVLLMLFFWHLLRTPLSTSDRVKSNHLQMARWIDRELSNGWITKDQSDDAQKLLSEFYGKNSKGIR